ncbi:MAG: AEC family transporter [Verrucomicrobiales bacterium]|nr:AEC family transporter [Verrucomicrobiota bacterium JB025]
MISPLVVVFSVLPVYILILAGAIARRTGIIRREHDEGIMRVVFSAMMPCYILDKLLGAEILRNSSVIVSCIVLGFCIIIINNLLAIGVGRALGLERGTGMRTFALAAGTGNYGYAAAPVVEILWGSSALAILFVHNIGTEIAIWSFGVMLMSGAREIRWRRLLNGPLVAVTVGLLLVVLRLDQHIEGPVREAMSMIGKGAFPVGIFIIGCTMIDMVAEEKPNLKLITGGLLVRLIIAPAVFIGFAKFLPIATELRQVLLVQAAVPASMNSILIARLYGGRPAVAVQIVLFTTAISILTLPWIISLGCRWLELEPLLP